MTSEFVLERIGALMDLLDAIPKGDIILPITIEKRSAYEKQTYGHGDVEVHLNSSVDIRTVAHNLGLPVLVDKDTYPDSDVLKVVDPQFIFKIFQIVDKSGHE